MAAKEKREEAERPGYGEGRQALLDAAVRVVAQKGLRGLTHRAVAAEAGVTQGLVTHHFGTRQTLIHEAIRSAGIESIGSTLTADHNPDLDHFVGGLQAFLDETVELQAFQYEIALEARRDPALAEDIRELYDAYIAATRASLAAVGIEADDTFTRLVFAALDGLSFQQLVYGPDARTDACVAELRALLASRVERA
jgi:DNA-binding transcriptional regulator YbjK